MRRIVRVAVKDSCYRIIPSKYPTVHVFDDVAVADDFNALYELQAMTNQRINSTVISPPNNYIHAPFVYLNPDGSRFSDGSFGVFYAGSSESVCIAETVYHQALFLGETNEPAQELDMRVIVVQLNANLYNLSGRQKAFPQYYHKTDYSASQAYGIHLYNKDAEGIRFSSVRHKSHDDAYAVFSEKVLSRANQLKHLVYVWDGISISNIYEKKIIAN